MYIFLVYNTTRTLKIETLKPKDMVYMVTDCITNKIHWKEIELSDRELFETTGDNREGIAMFSFASLFFWKEYYKTAYAVINGNIVCRGLSDKRNCVVYFPRGLNGNIKETIEIIASSCDGKLRFLPLTQTTAEKISSFFPNSKTDLLDGKCEYVYDQKDLAELAGKKYHAKRNHIAKFDKNYPYEYVEITTDNIQILADCAEHLYNIIENSPKDEYCAIKCAIKHFTQLNLRAAVIKADGKYAAYSIGSEINENTADIHFEKADRNFEGSYAKINNCFAKFGWGDMDFLNREEDLGIEGLRKAKLSYYPCRLNQMYSVEIF